MGTGLAGTRESRKPSTAMVSPLNTTRSPANAARSTGAIHLIRPGIGIAEPLRLARQLGELGQREALHRHRQRPALLAHAFPSLADSSRIALETGPVVSAAPRDHCIVNLPADS